MKQGTHPERQTDRYIERKVETQTGRQSDIDIQTYRQIDRL